MIYSILVLICSIYVMRKCAPSFDIASNFLTKGLGDGIKGPTVNAVASSLPELLISSMFLFYFKDIQGFAAGYATIIGSSAFNIAIIPTISFLYIYITKGKDQVFYINKSIVKQDSFFLLGAILILSLGFLVGVNFYLALLLILFYCLYIFYVVTTRSSNNKNKLFYYKFIKDHNLKLDTKTHEIYGESGKFLSSVYNFKLFKIFFQGKINNFSSCIVILISILLIGSSCYFLVLSIEDISHQIGINIFFGAFIFAAIASSVPDTIFSIQDAKNNKFSDSFSNAYGSNIFDICIGIGLPVLIYSLVFDSINMTIPIDRLGWIGDYVLGGNLFIWSLLILFIFTIVVSFIYYRGNLKLNKAYWILFLYLLFIGALIVY